MRSLFKKESFTPHPSPIFCMTIMILSKRRRESSSNSDSENLLHISISIFHCDILTNSICISHRKWPQPLHYYTTRINHRYSIFFASCIWEFNPICKVIHFVYHPCKLCMVRSIFFSKLIVNLLTCSHFKVIGKY